jgi:hypothetical protein
MIQRNIRHKHERNIHYSVDVRLFATEKEQT